MQELIPQIGAPVVDANLYKYGSSEPCFAPYIIRYYGARSVAFVVVLAHLGDILTDAIRHAMQAQIGLFNGGGFRHGISAGIITYGDVVNAQPQGRITVLDD